MANAVVVAIAVRALLWVAAGWLVGVAIQKGIFSRELVDTVSENVTHEQWDAIILGLTGLIIAAGNAAWVKITNQGTVRVPVEAVEHANNPLTPDKPIPTVSAATGEIIPPEVPPL